MNRGLETPFIPRELPVLLPSPPVEDSEFYFDGPAFDYANVPLQDIRAPRNSPVPWESKAPFSPGKQAALETLPISSPLPTSNTHELEQYAMTFEHPASEALRDDVNSLYDFEAQQIRKCQLIAELDRLEEIGRTDRCHMPHALKNSYIASKAVSTAMNQLDTVVPSDISTHQRQEYRNVYWALIRNCKRCFWAPRPWILDPGDERLWISSELSNLPDDYKRAQIDPIDDPAQIEPLRETRLPPSFGSPLYRRRRPSWPNDHYIANPDHPMRLIQPISSPHWKFPRLMERKRRVAHATQGRLLSELVAAAVYYGLPLLPSSVRGRKHNTVPWCLSAAPSTETAAEGAPITPKTNEQDFSGADSPRKLYRSQEVFRSGSAGAPLSYSLSSSSRPPLQKGYKTPHGSTASSKSKPKKQRASSLRFDSPQRQPSETSAPSPTPTSSSNISITGKPHALTEEREDEPETPKKPRTVVEVTEPADEPGSPEEYSIIEIVDFLESRTTATPEVPTDDATTANQNVPNTRTPPPTPTSPKLTRRTSVAERIQRYESTHLSPQTRSGSSTPASK